METIYFLNKIDNTLILNTFHIDMFLITMSVRIKCWCFDHCFQRMCHNLSIQCMWCTPTIRFQTLTFCGTRRWISSKYSWPLSSSLQAGAHFLLPPPQVQRSLRSIRNNVLTLVLTLSIYVKKVQSSWLWL